MAEALQCVLASSRLQCSDGSTWVEEEATIEPGSSTFVLYVFVSIFLTLFAGLMSGLTLGLLSLDLTALTVIMKGGDPKQRQYARKIMPLLKRHHLLLVTLLLANSICMEALPLFLDRITSPVAAVVISVTAVLFFGEVIPQAICSRYGLAIGAKVEWLVWIIIGIFFVVAYPIGKLLDRILGTEQLTFYRRDELNELVKLHAEHNVENEEPLTNDEVLVISGALDLSHKTVTVAMTDISKVFMLDGDQLLDRALFETIRNHGHSRIPVYENNIHNLIGLLLVKDLLGYDMANPVLVRNMRLFNILTVGPEQQLYEILTTFESGKGHMAAVQSVDPGTGAKEILGIITLEDVIEELINKEISDENDVARVNRKLHRSGSGSPTVKVAASPIDRKLSVVTTGGGVDGTASQSPQPAPFGIAVPRHSGGGGSTSALQLAASDAVNVPRYASVRTAGRQAIQTSKALQSPMGARAGSRQQPNSSVLNFAGGGGEFYDDDLEMGPVSDPFVADDAQSPLIN